MTFNHIIQQFLAIRMLACINCSQFIHYMKFPPQLLPLNFQLFIGSKVQYGSKHHVLSIFCLGNAKNLQGTPDKKGLLSTICCQQLRQRVVPLYWRHQSGLVVSDFLYLVCGGFLARCKNMVVAVSLFVLYNLF